jgi:hypothetical protein
MDNALKLKKKSQKKHEIDAKTGKKFTGYLTQEGGRCTVF